MNSERSSHVKAYRNFAICGLGFLLGGLTACGDANPGRPAVKSNVASIDATAAEQPTISEDDSLSDRFGSDEASEGNPEIYSLVEGKFRCRASGPGGREADLRVENKKGETRFRAKWEIDVGQGQVPGTVVNVAINNVNIGGIVLEADGNQLEGDIEMRGKVPAAVASVRAGTPVVIGALRCNFARD